MLLRITIIGVVAIGAMAAIRDGRVLRDAGLLSSCHSVTVNGRPDATMMRCSKGRLDGFPDLTNKSCRLVAVQSSHEYWRCDAPVVSSQTPSG